MRRVLDAMARSSHVPLHALTPLQARAAYERTKNLHVQKFVSKAALDQAEAAYKAAEGAAAEGGGRGRCGVRVHGQGNKQEACSRERPEREEASSALRPPAKAQALQSLDLLLADSAPIGAPRRVNSAIQAA